VKLLSFAPLLVIDSSVRTAALAGAKPDGRYRGKDPVFHEALPERILCSKWGVHFSVSSESKARLRHSGSHSRKKLATIGET
jgi:hypothetical protein